MRVKIAVVTHSLTVNGISSVIKNYYEKFDTDKFDVTVLAGTPISDVYKKTFTNAKIKVIKLPNYQNNRFSFYFQLYKNIKGKNFDILHVHGNSTNSVFELSLALIAHIKIRIMHIHNTNNNHPILHKIVYPLFNCVCTDRFACGEKAGSWIYGKHKYTIIPNGIDTEKFKFDIKARERIRKELKINDKIVIGHIGRINYQKNQEYLLDIFVYIAKQNDKVALLLVGAGPDYEKIKHLINSHPYKDRIILYGESNDTASLYSAIDVFVLPSRFEGLPIVLLEAQISGLPCVVSDKVTKELDFGNIRWCSIEDSPEKWAKLILHAKIDNNERTNVYNQKFDFIKKYQIQENVKLLEEIYLNLIEKNK